jgi:hypothetical protein
MPQKITTTALICADAINITGEREARRYLAEDGRQPPDGVPFIPFVSAAASLFAGTTGEMPDRFWTVGPAGTLMAFGGREGAA